MEIVNNECYVSLEVAKLLKEAGFDWKCKFYIINHCELYKQPTLEVAQRWLREVKDTYVIPQISDYEVNGCIWEYDYRVGIHNINPIRSLCKFKSYEEALEIGIKKVLEITLEKEE